MGARLRFIQNAAKHSSGYVQCQIVQSEFSDTSIGGISIFSTNRTIYLLRAESANGCLFACDTALPCFFDQSSLVVCRPLLLVALEVRHHESTELDHERDDHEDKAEN